MHVLDAKRGDPRHRSLYSAIDWSYQLLDPSHQLLMRRLAIFVGGFTLAAAEDVCADDDGELAASDAVYVTLAELVSKSLVMFDRDQNRYRLLEPVRMFARERLDEHGETAAVAARHAQWAFRASEATLADQVFGTSGAARDVGADLDNVHTALDWLDTTGDHVTFLRMVALLGFTWFGSDWRRGHVRRPRGVELASGARPRLRGPVLLSYGIVEQRAALYESSRIFEEAIEIFNELDDTMRLAWATFFLGRAELVRDNENCAIHMTAAVDMFHALRIPIGKRGPSPTWARSPSSTATSTAPAKRTAAPTTSRCGWGTSRSKARSSVSWPASRSHKAISTELEHNYAKRSSSNVKRATSTASRRTSVTSHMSKSWPATFPRRTHSRSKPYAPASTTTTSGCSMKRCSCSRSCWPRRAAPATPAGWWRRPDGMSTRPKACGTTPSRTWSRWASPGSNRYWSRRTTTQPPTERRVGRVETAWLLSSPLRRADASRR